MSAADPQVTISCSRRFWHRGGRDGVHTYAHAPSELGVAPMDVDVLEAVYLVLGWRLAERSECFGTTSKFSPYKPMHKDPVPPELGESDASVRWVYRYRLNLDRLEAGEWFVHEKGFRRWGLSDVGPGRSRRLRYGVWRISSFDRFRTLSYSGYWHHFAGAEFFSLKPGRVREVIDALNGFRRPSIGSVLRDDELFIAICHWVDPYDPPPVLVIKSRRDIEATLNAQLERYLREGLALVEPLRREHERYESERHQRWEAHMLKRGADTPEGRLEAWAGWAEAERGLPPDVASDVTGRLAAKLLGLRGLR